MNAPATAVTTPTLCTNCTHRRVAPGAHRNIFVTDQPHAAPTPGRLQWQREQEISRETERAVANRRSHARLDGPPREHDWCVQRSGNGDYYFCAWLGTHPCTDFDPALPAPVPSDDHDDPPAHKDPPQWSLSIGTVLEPPMELRATAHGFEVTYDVGRPTAETLGLDGNALFQTCLLFGGPGAGKTNLFKRMLRQVLAHRPEPGCLLLDPKGVLSGWMRTTLAAAGRSAPVEINPRSPNRTACNVLDLPMEPQQIGRLLADIVVAEAGGIDPGWTIMISDLLESGTVVTHYFLEHLSVPRQLTAAELLNAILHKQPMSRTVEGSTERYTAFQVREVAGSVLTRRLAGQRIPSDVVRAAQRIIDFYDFTPEKNRSFVRQAIESSLGELVRDEWAWLSVPTPTDPAGRATPAGRLYRDVHDRGGVVVVSIGQGSAAFQRSLCTLMKVGYQQTVLADLAEHGPRRPGGPFSVLACDEYAQIATEGRSGLVSDASFFSLSREAGCLALLALQSMATGRSRFDPSIRDRWEGIMGNVGLRVFMRLNDIETARTASEFAGRVKQIVTLQTRSLATQGTSLGDSHQMLDVELAPPTVFTNQLKQGACFVQGTVDVGRPAAAVFVQVPEEVAHHERAQR